MDLMLVRNAVVATVKSVLSDDWTGFPFLIDEFPSPAFFVMDPDDFNYADSTSGGVSFILPVRFCVSRTDEEAAHATISRLIDIGPGTPYAAFDANPNLSGTVESCRVRSLGRFSRYRTGGSASYLGAEQELHIMAS